jgi:hypothetical protein
MESDQADQVGQDDQTPDWVSGWMPQRHVEIVAEIDKLKEEAAEMESLGRLLWQTGMPLEEAVRDIFRAVGLSAELTPGTTSSDVVVEVGDGKRLLVAVTGTENGLTNKSPKIRQIFEASQDASEEKDRVVLVANVHRLRPVADREWLDPATSEALMIIKGVGAVFVTTATLFAVWKLSRENPDVATDHMLSLHGAEAGFVTLERPSESNEDAEEEVPSPGFANRLVSALKA